MAKAKKLPSGSWRVQVFSHYEIVGGKKRPRYRSFTAATKAEAELKAAKFATDKDAVTSPHITVGQAVRHYIDRKEAVLSPATIRGYETICRNQISEISDIEIAKLSPDDLQAWIGALSGRLSPKSVRNAWGLVSSAIEMFTSRTFRVTLPAKKPVMRHIPTDEDVSALLSHAGKKLRIAILLAGVGTLRRGEICGLTYADVFPDKNMIFVHSDMVENKNGEFVHKEMPKTSGSVRYVPLPVAVMEELGTGEPEEYVYKGSPHTITTSFITLRDSLGLSCCFHDLRHYAASIMHAIGIPDVYIMERGGWSTDSTLKAIYRNSLDDMSAHFAAQANDHFSAVISHKISHGNS